MNCQTRISYSACNLHVRYLTKFDFEIEYKVDYFSGLNKYIVYPSVFTAP